jgi:hypothetical protein
MASEAQDRHERGIVSSHDIVNEETALLGGAPPVLNDDEPQERWNSPTINSFRFISVNLTLVILGLNDSCIGVSFRVVGNMLSKLTTTSLRP